MHRNANTPPSTKPQIPPNITLKTGDIILGNWITVLGRISALGGQRWGHIAMIVRISSEIYIYEISLSSGTPIIIPLQEYLADPLLHELAVRQLKIPLTVTEEEAFKELLLDHKDATYPGLSEVFKRLAGRPPATETEHICSELIYSIIVEYSKRNNHRSITWNKDRLKPGPPLLPDDFVPTKNTLVDIWYEPTVKILVTREINKEQRRALLQPQLEFLSHHLV